MENFNEGQTNQSDLTLNAEASSHLMEARKWSMFLSIMGLVFLGIMLIALVTVFFLNTMDSISPFGINIFFPWLLLWILYIFPLYYLLQFSTLSKRAIDFRDSHLLAQAMLNLKRHYRYLGILVIVVVITYVVTLVYLSFIFGPGI